MKNLKRLGAGIVLLVIVAMTSFAQDTPPCANPGETHSPPCAAAYMTPIDDEATGETNAPPASDAEVSPSVAEVAIDLLQSVLLLF